MLRRCRGGGVRSVKEIYVGVGGVPKLVWSRGVGGDFEVTLSQTINYQGEYNLYSTTDFESFDLISDVTNYIDGLAYDNGYVYHLHSDGGTNNQFTLYLYRTGFKSGTVPTVMSEWNLWYSGADHSQFNYDEGYFHWYGSDLRASGTNMWTTTFAAGYVGLSGTNMSSRIGTGQYSTNVGISGTAYYDPEFYMYCEFTVTGYSSTTAQSHYYQCRFGSSTAVSYSDYWHPYDITRFNNKTIWAAGDGYVYICSDNETFDHGTRVTLPNSIGSSAIDMKFYHHSNYLVLVVNASSSIYFLKSTNGTSFSLSATVSPGSIGNAYSLMYLGNNGTTHFFARNITNTTQNLQDTVAIYITSDFSTVKTVEATIPEGYSLHGSCCKND